jgi:hypothetical protein
LEVKVSKARKYLDVFVQNPPLKFVYGEREMAIVLANDIKPSLQIYGGTLDEETALKFGIWIVENFGENYETSH